MKILRIIPKVENLKISKGTKDFKRIIPEEKEDNLNEIPKSGIFTPKELIPVENQEDLIKKLLNLYSKKIIPSEIIFDYKNPRLSVHNYLREIYIKQNLSILRTIPITILDYDKSPIIKKIKILAINGSPRKEGDTKRILKEEIEKFWTGPYYESEIIDLEHISECLACGGHQKACKIGCIIKDQMQILIKKLKEADILILGSPVYMDMPTARTIAFLSRLTEQTKHNRFSNIGKYASALASGYCSGTKAVISSLNNALEMMGFEIQGRSSREYLEIWRDNKTRGGVPNDFFWPE